MASRRSSWCLTLLIADVPSDAAQLAVKAADDYLESLLLDVAIGKLRTTEPAFLFEAVVAEANAAIALRPVSRA